MHTVRIMKSYIFRLNESNYGDVTFSPPDDSYLGFATERPPLPQIDPSYRVRVPGVHKLDADLVRGNRVLLCSERLKDCLEELKPPRVEFFPIRVFLERGETVPSKFFGLHIGDRWACLDYKRSVFDDRTEFEKSGDLDAVTSMQKVVLDESIIAPDSRLFYVENSPFPYLPVVRCRDGERLLGDRWSGLDLVRVEAFSWDEF